MRRFLFVLWFSISGTACAEEDIVLESDLNGSVWMAADFWTLPECPDDFGPIVVQMPPGWEYKTVEIECGKIVEPATEDDE